MPLRRVSSFGLRSRLLLLVAMAVLPAFLLLLLTAAQLRQRAQTDSEEGIARVLNFAVREQSRLIRRAERVLGELAEAPEVRGGDGQACGRLAARTLLKEREEGVAFANVGAIRLDGELFCSGLPLDGPVNVAHRLYFQRALEQRRFVAGEVQTSLITRQPTLAFATPLLGEAGEVQAMVFASLDLSWLGTFAQEQRLPVGTSLSVLDREGTLLVRYPDPEEWIGVNVRDTPVVRAVLSRERGMLQERGSDGVDRLHAFQPLERVPATTAGYLSLGLPTEAIFGEVDQLMRGTVGGLALVSILTLGIAWIFGNLLLVRPVRMLMAAAQRLSAGNLGARTRMGGSAGELGLLGGAFDEMAESLERREAERQQAQAELEQAVLRLQEAQDTLLRQERLRAMGEMASGIAHDFNNTLAPIVGFSELLLTRPEDLSDREKTLAYLRLIHSAGKDAAEIIGQLREFYRDHQPESFDGAAPVDVNLLLDQVIALTQPKWKDQALARGVAIHVESDLQPVPHVRGVEAELRQTVANLIFNAADALTTGGTITLRTRAYGQQVLVEVQDDGAGMTEEVRRRCLEPFFTTKENAGTGLGLSAVYGTMKRHGGALEIESEVGKGTLVRLRFPLPAAARAQRAKPALPARELLPLRVLVIDDDSRTREVVRQYLLRDGHAVETATNGQEGLERFQMGHFDLVVTDRAMPEVSGDEVAAKIKQHSPLTPVILLTGFGELMNAAGEVPPGVDIVISKPVTQDTLRGAVGRVVPDVSTGDAKRAEKTGEVAR